MSKYQFMFKPLFFIFNLLFATWLVLKIEKLSPSDFGRFESMFKTEAPAVQSTTPDIRSEIVDASELYRSGAIDSAEFRLRIDRILSSSAVSVAE